MQNYLSPKHKALLQENALADFDALWSLDTPSIEPINKRRGGWSGAYQILIKKSDGGYKQLFMKRQQNHDYASLPHLGLKRPTLEREFKAIQNLVSSGIPTPEPVYFSKRRKQGHWQAILITEYLAEYQPLNVLLEKWCHAKVSAKVFRALSNQIAATLCDFHQANLQHNCMYSKHIMVNLNAFKGPNIERNTSISIVDLEKTRRQLTKNQCALRDLSSLYTSIACKHFLKKTEYLHFFKIYLGINKLTPGAKALWKKLSMFTHKKSKTRGNFVNQQTQMPSIQITEEEHEK